MTEALPPIMQTRGLHLVSVGTTAKGEFRMEFHAPAGSLVKEVVVILTADEPVTPIYNYSMRDHSTSTYQTYTGYYGDPAQDDLLEMGGI